MAYYLQVLEIAWHIWDHTAKSRLQRENVWTYGSAFSGVEDEVLRFLGLYW